MLVANLIGHVVNIRLNDGKGNFSADLAHPDVLVQPDPDPDPDPYPYDLALGDLDGDGDLDLVTANVNDASVSIRLNDGTGRFNPHPMEAEVPVEYGPIAIVLGDLDGDGDLDLAMPSLVQNGRVCVRLNNGSGIFSAAPDVLVGAQPLGLELGDLDNDGDLDLAVANTGENTVSILFNNGSARFVATGADIRVGTYPQQMALGDLNGDGDLDLLISNNSNGTVSVRLNNGQGGFAAPATGGEVQVGGFPKGLVLGDVDADGDLDFVINTNNLSLYLNNGHAGFTGSYPGIVGIPSGAGDLALTDVDGDGDLDLFVPGFASLCHVRLNGVPPVAVPAPAPPTPAPHPDSVLVVSPIHYSDSLTVAPNPAHSQVYLSGLAPNTQIELLDVIGRVVYTKMATGRQATVPLPATIVPGLYLVRCGSQRRRIVVE